MSSPVKSTKSQKKHATGHRLHTRLVQNSTGSKTQMVRYEISNCEQTS